MRISRVAGRSVPPDQGGVQKPATSAPRAAALIVVALFIVAAFVVANPYLTSELRQGSSFLSGLTNTGQATQTSASASASLGNSTSASSTPQAQCSSAVSVHSLAAPDISNRAADIAYPTDYCTLASYALAQINADRAANGTGPVTLVFDQAAQQHADSMLYYGYFSHFDTQGYKPYMRYSLLGGLGADFENVAFFSYSLPHYLSTSSVENSIQTLEHSMVYDDVSCCNNGHRDNILDPMHNQVAIGVAYNSTNVYFDEEFENVYVNLNVSVSSSSSSNPYYVTMTGSPTRSFSVPSSVFVAFDPTPAAQTPAQLNNGPHEYGPGTLEGGVLPKDSLFGTCPQFTSGTTVCADRWVFTSTSVEVAFSLQDFVKSYGPGVYTLYLVLGSSTNSAITTISVFAP